MWEVTKEIANEIAARIVWLTMFAWMGSRVAEATGHYLLTAIVLTAALMIKVRIPVWLIVLDAYCYGER